MRKTTAILKAWLIAGTLDILSAFIYVYIKNGVFVPINILKFVASGLFGQAALNGGNDMAIAGLIIHYLIALTFTIIFFWLYPKIKIVQKNKVVTGIVYGLFVWIVMNLAVLPFTNIPHRTFDVNNALINIAILMLCIGQPLAFVAGSFYKKLLLRNVSLPK